MLTLILGLAAHAAPDPLIQDHLFEVVDTLRAETPADQPPAVAARRRATLDLLDGYARAGEFPAHRGPVDLRARDVLPPRFFAPGDAPRTPVFVDATGLHCAVGYLIAADDPALVADIVARDNHGYVLDMDAPRLADWAAHHGFTVDELAWIQPSYDPRPVPICDDPPPVDEVEMLDGTGETCGEVDVIIRMEPGCEVCGEGHVANLLVINRSNRDVEASVRLALRGDTLVEEDLVLPARSRTHHRPMLDDWSDLYERRAVATVDAPGNCAPESRREARIESGQWPWGPPECEGYDDPEPDPDPGDPVITDPGGDTRDDEAVSACSHVSGLAATPALLLALLPLLARRRR